MYKSLGAVHSLAERDSVEQELADRYGAVPQQVRNLLDYAALKLVAGKLWIRTIERKQEMVEVQFHAETKVEPERLMEFIAEHPGAHHALGRPADSVGSKPKDLVSQLQSVLDSCIPPPASVFIETRFRID
jgi:transcription-repair coupling factor (superfamily II helicase)